MVAAGLEGGDEHAHLVVARKKGGERRGMDGSQGQSIPVILCQ